MANRRYTVALGVLALMVLLSGCSMVSTPSSGSEVDGPDTEPDLETVFEGAYVHADDLEDFRGTVTSTVTNGSVTVSERVRIEERPYLDKRTEVRNASNPRAIGDVFVSNASMKWFYYPNSQVAQYFEPEEPFDNEEVRSSRAEMAERSGENYTLEYRGTERIADRETHALRVEAKNETVENGISAIVGDTEFVYAFETSYPKEELQIVEQQLWVDTEYRYPLKEKVVLAAPDGERIVMTERFESIEFNAGLDDGTFAFEPPENATVQNIS